MSKVYGVLIAIVLLELVAIFGPMLAPPDDAGARPIIIVVRKIE